MPAFGGGGHNPDKDTPGGGSFIGNMASKLSNAATSLASMVVHTAKHLPQHVAVTEARHCTRWVASHLNHGVRILSGDTATDAQGKLPAHSLAIVLIHGTADRSSGCAEMARHLQKQLPHFCHIVSLDFDDCPHGSKVKDYAESASRKCAALGITDAVLIGHSRGGLVVAHMGTYPDTEHGITFHLTESVAAPFQGSAWANATAAAQNVASNLPIIGQYVASESHLGEMGVDSAYLQQLNKDLLAAMSREETPLNAHFHGASADLIVKWEHTHPSGILAEGQPLPENFHRATKTHTHLSIMGDETVADGIALRIKNLSQFQALAQKHFAAEQARRAKPNSLGDCSG